MNSQRKIELTKLFCAHEYEHRRNLKLGFNHYSAIHMKTGLEKKVNVESIKLIDLLYFTLFYSLLFLCFNSLFHFSSTLRKLTVGVNKRLG